MWGILLVIIGILMIFWSINRSEFIIYRILVSRSEMMWRENVHRFYTVSGILVVVFGLLMLFGVI